MRSGFRTVFKIRSGAGKRLLYLRVGLIIINLNKLRMHLVFKFDIKEVNERENLEGVARKERYK